MVKEKEIRLDGLLTPVSQDVSLPLVFLEAQMQTDTEFYRRYFAGIFFYLLQYKNYKTLAGIINSKQSQSGLRVRHSLSKRVI